MSRPVVAYVLKAFPRLSETFILNEIVALRRAGMDVRVFALEEVREARRHPAAVRLLPHVTFVPRVRASGPRRATRALRRREETLAAGRWIGRRLRGSGVVHLHAHFAGPAATAASAAAAVCGAPFSFTAHAKDIFVDSVDWRWLGRLARAARAVVTVCEYNRRFLAARLPEDARIRRIHNGVDLGRWTPAPAGARSARVVAVGRLVPKKGFDLLIDAVARLRDRGTSVHCTIVGEGVERAALERRIAELGLARHVRLAGALPQPAVRRLVRNAGVVALPCRRTEDGNQDALPTVLLEAGACGVPVVSTRVAGVPEIVRHGVTGLLVPSDRPAALAAALDALLRDRAQAARLGRAARVRMAARFDERDATRALLGLFTGTPTRRAGGRDARGAGLS